MRKIGSRVLIIGCHGCCIGDWGWSVDGDGMRVMGRCGI